MPLIRLYKKLPLSIRNRLNFFRHRVNSNRLLLWAFSNIRHNITLNNFAKQKTPYCLRLGESRKFNGWISSNYQVFCQNFLDATKPFKSGPGARYLVIDNVIEHLTLDQGIKMLQNIFDCLIPGGVLRLATPNLRNIANVYLNPSLEELSSFKIDFSQHGIDIRFPPDLLKATFNNFGHQFGYIYDFETLQKLLEEIGFIGVEKFKPGKSNIDSLKNIENRIGESDQWGQLCLEATKPNHLSA